MNRIKEIRISRRPVKTLTFYDRVKHIPMSKKVRQMAIYPQTLLPIKIIAFRQKIKHLELDLAIKEIIIDTPVRKMLVVQRDKIKYLLTGTLTHIIDFSKPEKHLFIGQKTKKITVPAAFKYTVILLVDDYGNVLIDDSENYLKEN